jgi:hypothetical protein
VISSHIRVCFGQREKKSHSNSFRKEGKKERKKQQQEVPLKVKKVVLGQII